MKSKENYTGIKGIFKFIANIISWTALVILVLLALFLAYYTINNKLYAAKGEKFEPIISLFTIMSGSMEPNIKVSDVVVSKKVSDPKDIKVGDVITFTSTSSISKGVTITHRVIEITETQYGIAYKTKGDNNLSPDTAPAEFHNVIGKVILRIPKLGKVQSFLGTKGGWLLIIVLPAMFIIASDILRIFKLIGVKNKIEEIDKIEEENKQKRLKQEEIRKKLLKERLKLDKNENEPDPIEINKRIRIVVAEDPKYKIGNKKLESKEEKKVKIEENNTKKDKKSPKKRKKKSKKNNKKSRS